MSRTPKPIVIAGPTASGKSALAMHIAARNQGIVVNADALQVYDCWRVLTARPSLADEQAVPHRLFGHVGAEAGYSVGDWLREVASILSASPRQCVIVGGTGLYLSSLLNGLSVIPDITHEVRQAGNLMRAKSGSGEFIDFLRTNDPDSLAALDQNNPMRLQRAWEVYSATGRGLHEWQKDPAVPLINRADAELIVLEADANLLRGRIEARFDHMIANGAIEECRAFLAAGLASTTQSAKALGAADIFDYLLGRISLEQARVNAIVASRQYAKRQRTWFRAKMTGWRRILVTDEPTQWRAPTDSL